ncbi:ankyrin [Colletotrichum somersetense]|nr:ankyrin [Colletotrichum somersetense]
MHLVSSAVCLLTFLLHLQLFGYVGCGKAVLSTTILDQLGEKSPSLTLEFFFDFNNTGNQTLESLLRSLAFQLYRAGGEAASRLDDLFKSNSNGQTQPGRSALSACVESMLKITPRANIVLDALDECTTRTQLLSWIRCFASEPGICNIKLIVTGRPEDEFKRDIPRLFNENNCTLLDKKAAIQEALENLPSDLNEAYKRMLRNIPSELKSDAIRLLQFLVHAKQPLVVSAAIDMIATQIDGEKQGFNKSRRLLDKDYILRYCPSLGVITGKKHSKKTEKEIHLAHFSVKEYLARDEQFQLATVGAAIAKTCLTYLTDVKVVSPIKGPMTIKSDFPLARYAAYVWMDYARLAGHYEDVFQQSLLFLQDEVAFQQWVCLYHGFKPSRRSSTPPDPPSLPKLYYVCYGGLSRVLRSLLEKGADANERRGSYDNALQAASSHGHQEVVQILLDNGADINELSESSNTALHIALHIALRSGRLEIVQLLLDNGAGVEAHHIIIASREGHDEIVQLLRERESFRNCNLNGC